MVQKRLDSPDSHQIQLSYKGGEEQANITMDTVGLAGITGGKYKGFYLFTILNTNKYFRLNITRIMKVNCHFRHPSLRQLIPLKTPITVDEINNNYQRFEHEWKQGPLSIVTS